MFTDSLKLNLLKIYEVCNGACLLTAFWLYLHVPGTGSNLWFHAFNFINTFCIIYIHHCNEKHDLHLMTHLMYIRNYFEFSEDGPSYVYLHVGSFREIFQLYDLWYTVWPLISLPCSACNSYPYLGSFCFCDVLHMLCIGGQYMLFLLFLSPLRRRSLTNHLILIHVGMPLYTCS